MKKIFVGTSPSRSASETKACRLNDDPAEEDAGQANNGRLSPDTDRVLKSGPVLIAVRAFSHI
jgi:hypothetical protein